MRTASRYLLSFVAAAILCALAFPPLLRGLASFRPVSETVVERLAAFLGTHEAAIEDDRSEVPAGFISYGATPSAAALSFALSRNEHGILVLRTSVAHEVQPDLAALLEYLCTRTPPCTPPLGVDPSTLSDFAAAQGRVEQISNPELAGITLVDASEFDRHAKELARQGVNTDQPRLVHLSPVGFSSDRRQAILFLAEYCGSLCGGGFYLVLELRSKTLFLRHALLAWVS